MARVSSPMFKLLFISLLVLSFTPFTANAAERLCFPQTGQCIEGRFRQYWEQNGGLAVFGYPTTPARLELNPDTGRMHPTQWFERNRFELHPENTAPYDVLLGRLGDDRLKQAGWDWQNDPKSNSATPHYFIETGQAIDEVFWDYWRSHGLELGDPKVSERESLALFGMPITQPRIEVNTSHDIVYTQWFERARLEYHSDKRVVLLGLLSNEI